MALTNDDLKAIGSLLDTKLDDRLKPINDRLDGMDNRLNVLALKQERMSKQLDDLQLNVKIAERNIKRDIHSLMMKWKLSLKF